MKRVVFFILFTLLWLPSVAQTVCIKGIVIDENRQPLPFVNIYIEGTIEGAASGEDGRFELCTELRGELKLIASFIGYTTWAKRIDTGNLSELEIQLKPQLQSIREVVVQAGNYLLKSASTLEQKNAIDLITTGGTKGDLFSAIGLLPGTQAPGVDGRMLVRGGDSRESQTYIDGMHLLSPYTAAAQNTGSRSRFSAFLFDGINFSTGGYSPEYTQSLSSILPLTTSNESDNTKLGFKLMNVGPGGGGTKAWKNGSASFNADYTDMKWYHTLTDPKQGAHWEKPYRNYAGQSLLRFKLGKETYWKTFLSYDKTLFTHYEEKPFSQVRRELGYNEDVAYLSSTIRTRLSGGFDLFAGVASSLNDRRLEEAVVKGDRLRTKERELHLKAKAGKRFSSFYKLELGAESYLRRYETGYRDTLSLEGEIRHRINGLFISNDFNLTPRLFLNLSSRLEYTSSNRSYALLPRLALSYERGQLTVSGAVGKYQQMAENDYLIRMPSLAAEQNVQYLLGGYFRDRNRIYRVEIYHKTYDKLPAIRNGRYTSAGSGYSRGVDLFLNDRKFLKNWEYTIAYSYNDSKREYLDYPERATPSFVTRHNASLTLKYANLKWRSIISLSDRFASGRPYHNPNKEGFMNSHTPVYNTLDLGWTVLAHKKLIIYACLSNILNRRNVFGYAYSTSPDSRGVYEGQPVRQEQNRTFYIGFFLTLGKHVAYEASNF
ncbi:MAG: TonB-dependent receptor [Tannerellaceae bacterium]|jgi:hypothetical protein|nr:TonB-dependent receptor [Tannerellaceae bacterium]